MSLRINTNVGALNAYGNLSTNQASLQDAFEKLSSGLRINKAADDAAGLSISQGLTSQINGLTQAVRNAQDGTNVAQIADGALNTVQQILQRERDLAVQAANGGSQDSAAQAAAQSEITNLNTQLDNISKTTAFGGTKLLDGTYAGVFQVGANNSANE
ncbi:MAG TPA: flagellin, partial [Jatrophihabitans sp.]|nr:flagellin [Jatrophihabitans sp.]